LALRVNVWAPDAITGKNRPHSKQFPVGTSLDVARSWRDEQLARRAPTFAQRFKQREIDVQLVQRIGVARRQGGEARGRDRAQERQQRERLVLQLLRERESRANTRELSDRAIAERLAPQIERALGKRVSVKTVRKDIARVRGQVDRKLG
jgi:hypothetical protein